MEDISVTTAASIQIDEFYLDVQQDGSKLRSLKEDEIRKNPFPGLRPFRTREQDIFYGRKDQTKELVSKLDDNNFVAVIGSSGTGKSSLVRAGLIPALFGGNIADKGSNWKIAICRPGSDPIQNLSISLSSIAASKCLTQTSDNNKKQILEKNKTFEPILRASTYGILDIKELLDEEDKTCDRPNLLIIIDQFEELFRYDRKDLKSQNCLLETVEADFVDRLLECNSDPKKSIYVIITMRSDFLGECVKFKGLPEAINKSQYLVPKLNRDQLSDVIKGPVVRAGKKIPRDFVEILLNEIESETLKENLDQLPILQHALMRTYHNAFNKSFNDQMLYQHYVEVGGMKESLARHAQDVFDALGDNPKKHNQNGLDSTPENLSRKQLIAKIIFQALTDAISDQKGGRRPTELENIHDILKVVKADAKEVNDVLTCFREEETSFIMPPANTKAYSKLILDISHESLMRNWPELKKWMEEEVEAAKLYTQLNNFRELNERNKDEMYIRGVLLNEIVEWRNKRLHNFYWAARYQKVSLEGVYIQDQKKNLVEEKKLLYKKNILYLKQCVKRLEEERRRKDQRIKDEQLAKEKELEQEKLRQVNEYRVRRNKVIATISAFAAAVSIGLGVYAAVAAMKITEAETTKQKFISKAFEAQAEVNRQKTLLAEAETAKQKALLEKAEADKKETNLELKRQKAQKDLFAAQSESNRQKAEYALLQAKANAAALDFEKRILTEKAEAQKQALLNNLPKILAFTKEKFYQSLDFSQNEKDSFVTMLVNEKYLNNNGDTVVSAQLLAELNEIAIIRNEAKSNPNSAFLRALLLRDKLKSPLSESTFSTVVNNNLFYINGLNLPLQSFNYNGLYSPNSKAFYAVSKSGSSLAFKLNDTIKIFEIKKDFIIPQKDIIIKEKNSSLKENVQAQTMTFSDENHLLVFQNNTILKINKNTSQIIPIVIDDFNRKETKYLEDYYYYPAVYFDRNKLGVSFDTYKLKVYDLNKPKEKPLLANVNSSDGLIVKFVFTNDDNKIVVKQKNRYKIINLSPAYEILLPEKISYAELTEDSKNIIGTRNNSDSLFLLNLEGKLIDSFSFKSMNIDTFVNASISNIRMSPDRKKMMFQASNSFFPYVYISNNPIFSFESKSLASSTGQLFKVPYFNNSDLYFHNDNFITITSELNGFAAKIWKSFSDSLEEYGNRIFDNIAKALSNELEAKLVATNASYIRRDLLRQAKYVYSNLVDYNEKMYLPKFRKYNRNYFQYSNDTTQFVRDLNKVINLEEKYILLNPTDTLLRKDLSYDYWDLSWFQVLRSNYDSAVYSSKRGFELDTINNGIKSNEALGYLLKGDCEKAFSIYKENKGRSYLSKQRTFNEAFLNDLDILERLNFITPDKKTLYQHVTQIRGFLQGYISDLNCSSLK